MRGCLQGMPPPRALLQAHPLRPLPHPRCRCARFVLLQLQLLANGAWMRLALRAVR